ncbi:hypothetical protein ACVNIS_11455 [Sphaerotilaceae bacterium SBD11-9]
MREPYENILIGNFLFGFGLAMGRRSVTSRVNGCVNLLQQTPLDHKLGDVLVHYPGVLRLIEFKRDRGDMVKETVKLEALNAALSVTRHLYPVSREIHWFIQSRDGLPEFTVSVRPYLELLDGGNSAASLSDFTEFLADEAAGPSKSRFTTKDFNEYLQLLLTYGAPKGGSRTSSGMLVSVGADGLVRYVAVEDIRDLRLTRRELIKLSQQREQARMQERARENQWGPEDDRGHPLEHERSIQHGRNQSR